MTRYTSLPYQVQAEVAEIINKNSFFKDYLSVQCLVEDSNDIEFDIRNALKRQGMAMVVSTPSLAYQGHDGLTESYSITANIQVAEVPTIWRSWLKKNNLSSGTSLDVVLKALDAIGGPQSGRFGTFQIGTINQGEDGAVLNTTGEFYCCAQEQISGIISGDTPQVEIPFLTRPEGIELSAYVHDNLSALDGLDDRLEELEGYEDRLESVESEASYLAEQQISNIVKFSQLSDAVAQTYTKSEANSRFLTQTAASAIYETRFDAQDKYIQIDSRIIEANGAIAAVSSDVEGIQGRLDELRDGLSAKADKEYVDSIVDSADKAIFQDNGTVKSEVGLSLNGNILKLTGINGQTISQVEIQAGTSTGTLSSVNGDPGTNGDATVKRIYSFDKSSYVDANGDLYELSSISDYWEISWDEVPQHLPEGFDLDDRRPVWLSSPGQVQFVQWEGEGWYALNCRSYTPDESYQLASSIRDQSPLPLSIFFYGTHGEVECGFATATRINEAVYVKVDEFALKSEIPARTSDLENDSNFVDSAELSAAKRELEQQIAAKADSAFVKSLVDENDKVLNQDLSGGITTTIRVAYDPDTSRLKLIGKGNELISETSISALNKDTYLSAVEVVPGPSTGWMMKFTLNDPDEQPIWITLPDETAYSAGFGLSLSGAAFSVNTNQVATKDYVNSNFAASADIPKTTSRLSNDSGFIDSTALLPYARWNDVYSRSQVSSLLEQKAGKDEIPRYTSQLENDSGYLTTTGVKEIYSIGNDTKIDGSRYYYELSTTTIPARFTEWEFSDGNDYLLSTFQAVNLWKYSLRDVDTSAWLADSTEAFESEEDASSALSLSFFSMITQINIAASRELVPERTTSAYYTAGRLALEANYYTKPESDARYISAHQPLSNYYTAPQVDARLALKADLSSIPDVPPLSNYYTASQVDAKLAAKADLTSVAILNGFKLSTIVGVDEDDVEHTWQILLKEIS